MAVLFVVLILVAACSPAISEDPDSTPQVFLPHAEISEATPVTVDLPGAGQSTEVPATLEPAQDATLPSSPEPAPAKKTPVALTTYTVQPGDTLIGLALEFAVPMAAIQLSNDMGAETIVRVGQVLKVPQEAMWAEASPFWIVHQVVAGETLSELAAQFGLDLAALLDSNGLSDADLIAVGQSLVLPLDGPAEASAAVPAPMVVPEPEIVSTPIPETEAVAEAPAEAPAADVTDADAGVVESTEPTATAAPEPPPADVSALAGEILRRINEQRTAYALPPLAWNGTLANAAQLHADDCYARGWCGHTGSDGSTYKERIIRAGYDPVRWSECWAWYGTPEMAVAMWMDEVPPNDPHRRTILSDYLTEVGVGVVPGNGYGYYFIADFGTPR
ncbi:MAG: CAP domain-containing protein [Anaerolineae bacterium]|nr:CAP domain-containing protein [Anaerolineae bacterium]